MVPRQFGRRAAGDFATTAGDGIRAREQAVHGARRGGQTPSSTSSESGGHMMDAAGADRKYG